MRRPVPAVLVALVVAALGAVILGEYELAGARPILAGLLFGITIAEVLATLARPWAGEAPLWGAAALITEAGLVWATWISTGHELHLAAGTAWAGIVVGILAAPSWLRSAGRRGSLAGDET
ncbi:MAG TPA: hypothetical protein VM933_01450 [Acidimicrobiales bacterium]|nr:hypothetical protein [Acidimicrobiales bacterium]